MGGLLSGMILICGLGLLRRLGPVLGKLGRGLRAVLEKEQGEGQLSAFGTLCTTLAATLGTGNIVGVASAVTVGGPGALFWMVIASLLCMVIKYAECALGVRYRRSCRDGREGGAFYYIEASLGKGMAGLFAVSGALVGALGMGTLTQADGIVRTLQRALDAEKTLTVGAVPLVGMLTAFGVATLAGLVLWGGLRRITALCETVVPVMAVGYIVCCFAILIRFASLLPATLGCILQSAFSLRAGVGGWLGTVSIGVSRGIFSNEAGLGSASITAAAAKGEDPRRQGLVGMAGVFIDTTLMCTLSGLCVVITGAVGEDGGAVTSAAFGAALGPIGAILPQVFLCFFAFTTIVGWYYYAERCFCYLTGGRWEKWFRLFYVGMLLMTPLMSSERIWRLADLFNCGMALPNLLALWRLRDQIPLVKSAKKSVWFCESLPKNR